MDPLSNVLALLKPKNHLSAGFEAGGDWAVQFPHQGQGIKCGTLIFGECWLKVNDVGEPVLLKAGDSFLLPSGRPFLLASGLDVVPTEAAAIFANKGKRGVVTFNGGGEISLISSRFGLEGEHASILLKMLPPIILIRDEAASEALRWSVQRMMDELRDPQPGGFLIVQHLAHMILLQGLRLHVAEEVASPTSQVGWLFALADRQIGAAIGAIHADPAHRWTLQTLAAEAGMSRSTFALKFREKVGETPMDYLTRWRMLLASDRLIHSGDSISVISASLGYESESAFSTAFRKTMGCSPRQYGRGERPNEVVGQHVVEERLAS
jgi:AraC-like DNA-binding protein